MAVKLKDLSPDQVRAFDAIMAWARDRNGARTFSLHGFAGTGKTTVGSVLRSQMPGRLMCCAFTGKAASVLARKMGAASASTFHSIFKVYLGQNQKTGEMIFADREDTETTPIVLIDESSMVTQDMLDTMLRAGARVLALGDPGQLPPVKGVPAFEHADFILEKIHRQAADNPIIRAATDVRQGRAYTAAPGSVDVFRGDVEDDFARAAGVILCGTNGTRQGCNKQMRRILGFDRSPLPQAGELVVALKNLSLFGIYNGAVYTVTETVRPHHSEISIDVDGSEVRVPADLGAFLGRKPADDPGNAIPFDFGYALTVHKAQGSEWPHVIVVNEANRLARTVGIDPRRWLYTAITRASERVSIIEL